MGKKRAAAVGAAAAPVFPFPASAAGEPDHFSDYGFDPQLVGFFPQREAKRPSSSSRRHQPPPLESARFKLQKPISKKHHHHLQKQQQQPRRRHRWWSSAASAALLLFVCLEEGNRETAVEAGAASAAVEAVAASGPVGPTAERALAALELLCTAPSGAVAVQREALAAPVLAHAVEGMSDRGRECGAGERKGGRCGNW